MTGTFASFGNALSALRYHQVVMDVSSGNVANVSTDGYARRRVVGEATGAPAQPAMWSRHDGEGNGVRVGDLQRMVDPFLDARARREHGNQAGLDVRAAVLARVESGIGEPGDTGVSAALADFRSSWHDLANNPGSEAARSQVLSTAGTLADALSVQRRNVEGEEGDQRQALLATAEEVNTLAADLAVTNRNIAIAEMNGTEAGVLLDQRDALALRLSELTGATATVNAKNGFDVSLGGVALVAGAQAGQLAVGTGVNPDGTADGNPVSFTLTPPGGPATDVTADVGGEAGGVAVLLSTTLPNLRVGIDGIAQQLADDVNAAHQLGHDQDGVAGGPLFRYDPTDPWGPLVVEITDPRRVAASSVAGAANLDGGNATGTAAALAGVDGSYQRLVADFGTQVASVRRLAGNQQVLTQQVDASREQLSGVSLDEEMVTMLQAQRAYEAAARVMTTIDSVLDTLINRTGLVR
jgi:flagellar hook-associated protein 1